MGDTADEWAELDKYELLEKPNINNLDYPFTKSYRRKYATKKLLIYKRILKSTIKNYFPQRRDAISFVFDIVKVHEIANESDSNVWLNIDFMIESGLYKRKKSQVNKK